MASDDSLRILLVDDEEIIHRSIGDYLRDMGHRVVSADTGTGGLETLESEAFDVAFVDLRLPGINGMSLLAKAGDACPTMPVVVITGHGTMETVIDALRLGAADFLAKPVKLAELDAVLAKCENIRALRREELHLRETIRGIQTSRNLQDGNQRFIGVSAATQHVKEQIRTAVEAQCDTILVTGGTGTGKEVAAREIHSLAGGDEAPFIAVSCPAIPDSLVESELFGHVRGAFTGATLDRAGYFELADNGTLFLDEVGDLSGAAQAKLLRVLETRCLRRVGGSEEIAVNLRVVAATNADLTQRVEDGTFRGDLFYRLNVFAIHLLPLCERKEDIVPLAKHFLAMYVRPRGLPVEGFTPEALQRLRDYAYPGNARELRNIVERAAILCRTGAVREEHLSMLPVGTRSERAGEPQADEAPGERARILAALEEARWNRRKASALLGVPYSTLRYKLKSLRIE